MDRLEVNSTTVARKTRGPRRVARVNKKRRKSLLIDTRETGGIGEKTET